MSIKQGFMNVLAATAFAAVPAPAEGENGMTMTPDGDDNVITLAQAQTRASISPLETRRNGIRMLLSESARLKMNMDGERIAKGLAPLEDYPDVVMQAADDPKAVIPMVAKHHSPLNPRMTLSKSKHVYDQLKAKEVDGRRMLVLVHPDANNKGLDIAKALLTFAKNYSVENPDFLIDSVMVVYPEDNELDAKGAYKTLAGPAPNGTLSIVHTGEWFSKDVVRNKPVFILGPLTVNANGEPRLNPQDASSATKIMNNLNRAVREHNATKSVKVGDKSSSSSGGDTAGAAGQVEAPQIGFS